MGEKSPTHIKEEWGYGKSNGPAKWKEAYPIAEGSRQSPIDIVVKDAVHDKRLNDAELTTRYAIESDFEVSNTGHSIKVQIKEYSELSGGPLHGKYRLEQFHLHWGRQSGEGSEHTIDGKSYDAELHLVHWNSTKYQSFSEAADKPDGLAVLGYMVQIGKAHDGFQKITDAITKIKDGGKVHHVKGQFNPQCLINDLKSYWTYPGSLTTPPLYESVTWIVFKDAMQISQEQMDQLRSLRFNDGKPMVDNYRPPVPRVNGRKVACSFPPPDKWGYEDCNGPEKWKLSFPIAEGPRQSPINIVPNATEYDQRLNDPELTTQYASETDVEISNTGHSIKVQINNHSALTGGPLDGLYRLEQFHLHWGQRSGEGSEHTINGKSYDAELHLVHWNSTKYSSFSEAADKPDGLAVLGYMVQVGQTHEGFKAITDAITNIQDGGKLHHIRGQFNPQCLINDLKSYWTYLGSLTTPPLYESVTWIVFKDAMQISQEQMDQLRSLRFNNGKPMVNNFRPPVPTVNGRKVRCSFS